MRYDTLPRIEADFRREAAPALTPYALPVPGENLTLRGQLFKPNRSDYYYASEHNKQRIVLHFTAGNVRSDLITFTQQSRHVSVAFVVARDGTIYQLFPAKYWSGHLGAGVGNGQGTGNPQDKATIGIELSNYGYLVPRGQTLETIYSRLKNPATGKIGPADPYCSLADTAAYTKIDQPFREQTYYATATPAQLDSLIILLRYLTKKYDIPRQFLPPDKRFATTQDVLNFKGIVSHVNYRSSGKWDIGPAFDWDTVIGGVQAAQYDSPSNTGLVSARSLKQVLTTEDEIAAEFPKSKNVSVSEVETTDNEGYDPNDFEEKSLLEVNTTVAKKKLYALLVGINDYDHVGKLHGCLNDVKAVRKYLQNNPDFDAEIKELTDQAATRAGVADGFRNFLSQAGKDDTVLFYYSGHGTQEQADVLWGETDERLECLVCYDGETRHSADFLLTDKELRYLIHELSKKTKAHIVTVFDCCHSGDNTRNAAITQAVYKNEDRRERRVTRDGGAFPRRKWNEFLFGDAISLASVQGKKPDEFLPQGTHVQMAACESNQVALEISGAGVFTKTLLKTLTDCGGNINYDSLRSRVRQYMRAGFEQTPRVYMPIAAEKLLKAGFLNRTVEPDKMFCEATRNNKLGWQLNVGAIHGVDAASKVTLYNPKNPDKTYTAQVRDEGVFVDYTLLDVKSGLDRDTIYKAKVAGMMTKELILKMENHDGNPREMKEFLDTLFEKTSGGFALGEEKEAVATDEKDSSTESRPPDYTLHVRSGEMYLTRPDDPFRPLVRPMSYIDAEGKQDTSKIIEMLRHVSRWHFIKNLQNKDKPANFPAQPLKIELTRLLADGTSEAIDIADDTAEFEYEQDGNNWKGEVQIKLTNTTQQDLYLCAAYLGTEFQCFLNFLPSRVELLPAHKSVLLEFDGKKRISLQLDKVKQEYNWPKWQETLKFIVSTSEFVAEALGLEELPAPPTTAADRGPEEEAKGGLVTSSKAVGFSGWLTQTLHLAFENPKYNQISGKTLEALLGWEETAYFAAGLYYDVEMEDFGKEPILKLKKGLVVPASERGILQTIGMKLGNVVETAQRRKRYRNLSKDLNRTRIVAEGDSWFQYPIILQDVLDQLYKVYAICNFAEAGDTLENYLKKKEYVKPIGEQKANFFLVSGGGNDVLGDEFKDSLRATPDPSDPTLRRYLDPKFFAQLDKLDRLYEQMFTDLFALYPDLHILVHCYDYIIPVDTSIGANQDTTSWSGKHMGGKYKNGWYMKGKVEPQSTREELIRYIVDEFATRLNALTQRTTFKGQVSFVDTRGLVKRGRWKDEIHPKNEGFALVADKFIEEIERVKTKNNWP